MAVHEGDVETPFEGMIDVADKPMTRRTAVAKGRIQLSQLSVDHIRDGTNPKGDVLENAKLAAILAVKKTPELVFMCHPIKITSVTASFVIEQTEIIATVTVRAEDRTGVEIEAIAGVMNALLAIFDLCKRYEKDEQGNYPYARISQVEVIKKVKEELP